jgi:hypothetical protein
MSGQDDTWRTQLSHIRRASDSLRDEAKAESDPALKSEGRRLGEELLDILTQLKQLQERSPTPPTQQSGEEALPHWLRTLFRWGSTGIGS